MFFVKKSSYKSLKYDYDALTQKVYRLEKNEFLLNAHILKLKSEKDRLSDKPPVYTNNASDFSDDDLKKLIMLCHPDKHNGKSIATEITTKLLLMRKR